MKRIYITGISGTGKSTIAEELKKQGIPAIDIDREKHLCHWVHTETGDSARWEPGKGVEFLEKHKYLCKTGMLRQLMNQYEKNSEAIVVAGLCENQQEMFKLFDTVILLHCDEKVFLYRIDNRKDHRYGKLEPERNKILGWYREVEREALAHGAVAIDVDRPLGEVITEIIKII